jgi:hypothetical protein
VCVCVCVCVFVCVCVCMSVCVCVCVCVCRHQALLHGLFLPCHVQSSDPNNPNYPNNSNYLRTAAAAATHVAISSDSRTPADAAGFCPGPLNCQSVSLLGLSETISLPPRTSDIATLPPTRVQIRCVISFSSVIINHCRSVSAPAPSPIQVVVVVVVVQKVSSIRVLRASCLLFPALSWRKIALLQIVRLSRELTPRFKHMAPHLQAPY